MSTTPQTPKQIHRTHQKRINRDPALRKRTLPPYEKIPSAELILRNIDQFRFLTNEQIGELLFRRTLNRFGKVRSEKWRQYQNPANDAIGDLTDHGLITKLRIFQTHRLTGNIFQSTVNILTPAGKRKVQEAYDRDDEGEALRPTSDLKRYSNQKIDHELEIIDATIALKRAIWSMGTGYDVLEWHDDDMLSRDRDALFQTFLPDAWCVVEAPGGRLCPLFFEIDRGTETIMPGTYSNPSRTWLAKMGNYGDYFQYRYKHDPFYVKRGFDLSHELVAQKIVLTVTTSQERLENMLEATRKAGGRNTYWYTTRQLLYGTPNLAKGETWNFGAILEPIWSRVNDSAPVSLRDHIVGSPLWQTT